MTLGSAPAHTYTLFQFCRELYTLKLHSGHIDKRRRRFNGVLVVAVNEPFFSSAISNSIFAHAPEKAWECEASDVDDASRAYLPIPKESVASG